jgi:hypothetical protein
MIDSTQSLVFVEGEECARANHGSATQLQKCHPKTENVG